MPPAPQAEDSPYQAPATDGLPAVGRRETTFSAQFGAGLGKIALFLLVTVVLAGLLIGLQWGLEAFR
jgi:hypothetical protein